MKEADMKVLAAVAPDGTVAATGPVNEKHLRKAAKVAKASGATVNIVRLVDVEGVEWVHFLAG